MTAGDEPYLRPFGDADILFFVQSLEQIPEPSLWPDPSHACRRILAREDSLEVFGLGVVGDTFTFE